MGMHRKTNATPGRAERRIRSTDRRESLMAAKKKSGGGSRSAAPSASGGNSMRIAIIAVLALVVVFGLYRVITGSRSGSVASQGATTSSTTQSGSAGADAQVSGPVTEGSAVVAGGVQKIDVDVTGVYTPNTIKLKAGVPTELTFKGGQGCTVVVHSDQLGFREDLSSGPKTVKLAALQPGTYPFSCGMNMVFGKIVVN
jgi:plastocyanin